MFCCVCVFVLTANINIIITFACWFLKFELSIIIIIKLKLSYCLVRSIPITSKRHCCCVFIQIIVLSTCYFQLILFWFFRYFLLIAFNDVVSQFEMIEAKKKRK